MDEREYELLSNNFHLVQKKIREAEVSSGRPPGSARMIAVTKFRPNEYIKALFLLGQREFGESRLQEAVKKQEALSLEGVTWHFIGPLQANKVTKVVHSFPMIHSVDSFALAKKISEAAEKCQKTPQIFIQVNPLNEPTKQGVMIQEVEHLLERVLHLPSLKVVGLMSMAPLRNTLFQNDVDMAFSKMGILFSKMKERFGSDAAHFTQLSMGMSQDFEEAIRHGAILLRIGSLLFQGL